MPPKKTPAQIKKEGKYASLLVVDLKKECRSRGMSSKDCSLKRAKLIEVLQKMDSSPKKVKKISPKASVRPVVEKKSLTKKNQKDTDCLSKIEKNIRKSTPPLTSPVIARRKTTTTKKIPAKMLSQVLTEADLEWMMKLPSLRIMQDIDTKWAEGQENLAWGYAIDAIRLHQHHGKKGDLWEEQEIDKEANWAERLEVYLDPQVKKFFSATFITKLVKIIKDKFVGVSLDDFGVGVPGGKFTLYNAGHGDAFYVFDAPSWKLEYRVKDKELNLVNLDGSASLVTTNMANPSQLAQMNHVLKMLRAYKY